MVHGQSHPGRTAKGFQRRADLMHHSGGTDLPWCAHHPALSLLQCGLDDLRDFFPKRNRNGKLKQKSKKKTAAICGCFFGNNVDYELGYE